MQKEILNQLLEQNQSEYLYFTKNINIENIKYRLNEKTASVGFILRHIAETAILITQFYGYKTEINAATISKIDTGLDYDLEESRKIITKAFENLKHLIQTLEDKEWKEEIETTWFGKTSRIKLFSIFLFHNSHHCGQISSAILKGNKQIRQNL